MRSVQAVLFDTKLTKRAKDTKSELEPPKPVLEQHAIEIHQESHGTSRQSQIGQYLRLEEARQSFDGFDLHDDQILDQKIEPIAGLQPRALEDDR